MSVNSYAQISVYALLCFAWGCGGSDSTGPAKQPQPGPGNQEQASVQLTGTPDHLTAPGQLEFVATVSWPSTATGKIVKFYKKEVGSNAAPLQVGADSVAPFTYTRSISNADDNGTQEFTAKAYSGETEMASSNAVQVVIKVPDVPLAVSFFYAGPLITKAGNVYFLIDANKRITRVEVYHGSTKVVDTTTAADTVIIGTAVTAADNGTQTYSVKAYDAGGAVAQSRVYSVIVDIRWTLIQNVGSFHSTEGVFIATDAANAIYYAGTTDSRNTFLVKYDADGQEQWSRTFGGPDNEYANSIAIDAFGRVYVSGTSYSASQINVSQCFVNVYDGAGGLTTRQIKPTSANRTSSCFVATDRSNNLYAIGYASDGTRSWLFVVKYDSDGNVLWSGEINPTLIPGSHNPDSQLTGLVADALGGGVYIGGYTGSGFDTAPDQARRDLVVIRLDGDGNQLWESQYGTAGVLTFSAGLTADPNGGVYVAGSTDDPNQRFSHSNALIASFAADGTRRWVKTVDGGWFDAGYAITVNSRGVYLVGATDGEVTLGHEINEWSQGGQGFSDILVAQYSVAGDLLSIRLLGTPKGDFGSGILTGVNGDIYVAGATTYDQPNRISTPLLARLHDAP